MNRWRAVGLLGTGSAWNDIEELKDKQSLITGATGFRYEIAHDDGLLLGLDVAFGHERAAICVRVGSP